MGLSAGDCGNLYPCQLSVCWFDPAQTRTNAPKTMVVASTNVSTPLGAICASAEMASCCMKTAMTVKKVKSPVLPSGKPRFFKHGLVQGASCPVLEGSLYSTPGKGTEKAPAS